MKIVWTTYDFAAGTATSHERDLAIEQVIAMNPLLRLIMTDDSLALDPPAPPADEDA
jgi:hypothetical protein